MASGWECAKCTYYHTVPGARCAMCDTLRISKKQMADFIRGIPIDNASQSNNRSPAHKKTSYDASAKDSSSSEKKQKQQSSIAAATSASTQSRMPTRAKPSPLRPPSANPYIKQRSKRLKMSNDKGQNSSRESAPCTTASSPHTSKRGSLKSDASSAAATTNEETVDVWQRESDAASLMGHRSSTATSHCRQRETGRTQQARSITASCRAVTSTGESANAEPATRFQQQTLNGHRAQRTLRNQQKLKPPPVQQKHQRQMAAFLPKEYKQGPVPLDPEAAKEWFYPKDEKYPRRQYQFDIARTAVLHNTLVGLPTGLGKTLIAAVVMYNYYRWFPTGKVVFMAPTVPLANQQVAACHAIVGIPETDTALLTGRVANTKRGRVWDDKRAFFCTPQTMQKDLENGRVEAQKVVLVVLDEAHRARGDYAYNSIIKRLQSDGAHFRVLGLSATPGSQIKIIQEVIDSLRINKVECRSDEDPDVKQYVHDRQTEIVLIPTMSACKDIETTISNILAPELKTLRERNALLHTGNRTLSQYSILKARKGYIEKTGDHSLNSIFEVSRVFVELRNLLFNQGIGVMRTKLMALHSGGKILGRVIRSEEFSKLLKLVQLGSCDPNSSKPLTVEEKVMNNPKLQLLQDVLLEHFERVRSVSGEAASTRAIVFSQLRDSVGEIVSVLKTSRPILRPRHFIGQGKGSSGSSSAGNNAVLKGMPQAEQQQVIAQFRADEYNVLVCTCIGEEGLDIGEVDLIVNFDSVQSPVRMLQRVGRTGRKRSGRVVFLLSESEKKTYHESRLREKTILNAMKQPNAFAVTPTVPMLPAVPALCEFQIRGQSFHMSQVEGNGDMRRNKRNSSLARSGVSSSGRRTWRLPDDGEAKRAAALGDTNVVKSCCDPSLSAAVRKRLLSARVYAPEIRDQITARAGRLSTLLHSFEREHAQHGTLPSSRRSFGGLRHSEEIDAWFPTTTSEAAFESIAWGKPDQRRIEARARTRLPVQTKEQEVCATERCHERRDKPGHAGGAPKGNEAVCSLPASNTASASLPPTTAKISNPYTAKCKAKGVTGDLCTAQLRPQAGDAHFQQPENPVVQLPENDKGKNGVEPAPSAPDTPEDVMAVEVAEPAQPDVFKLPTQSSSSSSDEEDADDDSCAASPSTKGNVIEEISPAASPKQRSTLQIDNQPRLVAAENTVRTFHDTAFSLPTQSSSSSEEEEEDDGRSAILLVEEEKDFDRPVLGYAGEDSDESVGKLPKRRKRKRITGADEVFSAGQARQNGAAVDDSPEPEVGHPHSKDADACLVDTDTESASGQHPEPLEMTNTTKLLPDPKEAVDLTHDEVVNTQESKGAADEIVCAVCQSGESPDEDPIYLCDGPGNGVECNLAVHATCYSVSIENSEDEWRCDPCAHRFNGGTGDLRCAVCEATGGPLKSCPSGNWVHTFCTSDLERRPNAKYAKRSKAKRKQRKIHHTHFLHAEAEIDSDEDMDGDEGEDDDIIDIEEEEELHSSFINDSSQLGGSPNEQEEGLHQAVDRDRDVHSEFTTPMLNRRMRRQRGQNLSQPQRLSTGSDQGLGNMTFIRSVIDHHRQGGTAEEIEELYEQMAVDLDEEEVDMVPERPVARRTVVAYRERDSEEEWAD